jgi:hypothetical protein
VTETDGLKAMWTDADTESLFSTLGKYWMIFQWIEGLLDQTLQLAWGHENWASSHDDLAKMANEQKIEAVRRVVLHSPEFSRVHTRPEWCAHFDSVLTRLHVERRRRNMIIHSQILFEFADAWLAPPLLSKRTKAKGKTDFDRNYLSKEFQAELLKTIGELAVDMSFIRAQLIHDYESK